MLDIIRKNIFNFQRYTFIEWRLYVNILSTVYQDSQKRFDGGELRNDVNGFLTSYELHNFIRS